MLRKQLPYLLVTLLIGVMIGCGSSNPLVEKAESNIKSQNPQVALEAANESIEKYPEDPLGYYYKGVALSGLAKQENDPSARRDYYKRMNETFAEGEKIAANSENTPDEINRIPTIKKQIWSSEHNLGIKYFRNDSLKNTVNNPLQYSEGHLENATMVQPDSAMSWDVLAQIAGANKSYKRASSAKSQYLKMIPDSAKKATDYMQLGSYHFNQENNQQVVKVFEEAAQLFPENKDIISNLADAYNRVGKSDKAISTTEKLVQQNPEEPKFHQVLGTQLYKKALTLGDTVSANKEKIKTLKEEGGNKQKISNLEQENKKLSSQITELENRAEKELKTTVEYNPENPGAYNTLGVIYQNKAKAKFDKRNMTEDNAKAKKLDEEGRKFLRQSMKYYEQAAEIDPDNKDYWRSLFSIYTNLGMDKKAKKAMKKAGMN
ncbi:Tetratricopeptide repeat-containing protein [Fodinibius salinus]|uniref:Tetratricopeptide repeat-containing protein n=1 Tax=Fodinibius salinus TaxID=860790 RepID=A0A5D3YP20_9BACT|nr:tetratricopeptide repeat protein [Fodinibius salinus]TYP94769.1 Tetratricopeptide repeat-containing protein [Fodinibius salinus]